MPSSVAFLILTMGSVYLVAQGCFRKAGIPQKEDLSPEGWYVPRSPYQRRSVYGPEQWKKEFLLPREEQPDLTIFPNGTKILESCMTTPMLDPCVSGCSEDFPARYTTHTGRTCFRPTCNQTKTCQGVHCRCCERINCTDMANHLREVPELSHGSIRSVENCTRRSLSSPCPVSESGSLPPGGSRCPVSAAAARRVRTFLNATCAPLSCRPFRRCAGVACECCQMFTCVARPNESDRNLDFSNLPSHDQNLLDLYRLRYRGPTDVKNEDFQRKRYHYYYSMNGRYASSSSSSSSCGVSTNFVGRILMLYHVIVILSPTGCFCRTVKKY